MKVWLLHLEINVWWTMLNKKLVIKYFIIIFYTIVLVSLGCKNAADNCLLFLNNSKNKTTVYS